MKRKRAIKQILAFIKKYVKNANNNFHLLITYIFCNYHSGLIAFTHDIIMLGNK